MSRFKIGDRVRMSKFAIERSGFTLHDLEWMKERRGRVVGFTNHQGEDLVDVKMDDSDDIGNWGEERLVLSDE